MANRSHPGKQQSLLPTISNEWPLPERTRLILEEIAKTPSADFVLRAGIPHRIVDRGGEVLVEAYKVESLRGFIARKVRIEKAGKDGSIPVDPSKNLLEDILNLPVYPAGIPTLERVANIPVLTDEGELRFADGFDHETGIYFDIPQELRGIQIPTVISRSDLAAAVETALGPFQDFPLVSDHDRANLLAILVAMVAREHIDGPSPLALVDGNRPRVGKDLLMELAQIIAYGRRGGPGLGRVTSQELRKRLFSLLGEARPFHVLGNVEGVLSQDALAMFLTSDSMTDRLLGLNRTATFKNRLVLAATGNNLRVGGDIRERCILIQLHSAHPNPSRRDDFRCADIRAHVKKNRAKLVTASLTLVAAWLRAGKPAAAAAPRMGGFEAFIRVTAGVLDFAGYTLPLGNREVLTTRDDDEEDILIFLASIHDVHGATPVTSKQIVQNLDQDILPAQVHGHREGTLPMRLSKFLRRIEGRPFGRDQFMVMSSGIKAHTRLFTVIKGDI